jgi:hypothetical protein
MYNKGRCKEKRLIKKTGINYETGQFKHLSCRQVAGGGKERILFLSDGRYPFL